MRYETSARIHASPERVWSILTTVERTPEWTASVTAARPDGPGPLAVGSTVRIKQPRLPAADWRVTELTPLRSFTWTSAAAGVTTAAVHTLAAAGDDVDVTFTVEQTGPLAPLVGALLGRLTRRYVDTELAGLARASEAAG